jgi:hypothetical protein
LSRPYDHTPCIERNASACRLTFRVPNESRPLRRRAGSGADTSHNKPKATVSRAGERPRSAVSRARLRARPAADPARHRPSVKIGRLPAHESEDNPIRPLRNPDQVFGSGGCGRSGLHTLPAPAKQQAYHTEAGGEERERGGRPDGGYLGIGQPSSWRFQVAPSARTVTAFIGGPTT